MDDFSNYGINVSGSGQQTALCPQCSATRKKKTVQCLSVNMDEGTWNCHHCGWTGGLKTGNSHSDTRNQYVAPPKTQPNQLSKPSFSYNQLSEKAFKWFEARGISQDTLVMEQISSIRKWVPQVQKERDCIAFPYFENGEVVNVKYRDGEKNFTQEKNAKSCFYRLDCLKDQDVIYICEGEIDALSLVECGYGGVASIPCGAGKVTESGKKMEFLISAEEHIENATKVYLVTDKDEVGIEFEMELARRIGKEKCWRVFYNEYLNEETQKPCKDINDVLKFHGQEAVKKCLDQAKEFPVEGVRTFQDYKKEIYKYKEDGGIKGISTGYYNLDKIFTLQEGGLVIYTGIPGSGKSELLDCLALNTNVKEGWKWAFFSPENLPVAYHFQKFAEKMNGTPFSKINGERLDITINHLSDNIKLILPGDNGLTVEDILSKAKACVLRYGIKGLVIDPYNEIIQKRGRATETEYVSQMLAKLRNFSRAYGVTIIVVAHPTKLRKDDKGNIAVPTPYDISGGANWYNKGDLIMAIWRDFKARDNKVQIHVHKVRFKTIGKIGMAELEYDIDTGRYADVHRYAEDMPYKN